MSVGWAFVTAVIVVSMVGSLAVGWWVYRRVFASGDDPSATEPVSPHPADLHRDP